MSMNTQSQSKQKNAETTRPSGTTQTKASGPSLPKPTELEDIEDMRRREGIDDVELKKRIRALAAGDHVNVTFLIGGKAAETWQVRITSIKGTVFRAKLARRSGDQPRSILCPGANVVFAPRHIHSLAKAVTT